MPTLDASRFRCCFLLKAAALVWMVFGGALGHLGAWAADSKASKYYEDALARYEKKDLAGAIIQLKNALQIDNTMMPVQMLLGKALLQNGEVAAAEVALTEALRLGANRAEVAVPLGQAYLAQGKPNQVLEKPALALDGLPPAVRLQVLLLRAAASTDMGDDRGTLRAIEAARAIDPNAPALLLAEIPMRIRAKQFAEARAAAERAVAALPESVDAWYQKGSIAQASGDLQSALAAYERALKLDATHIDVRVARAGLYVDMGRVADATRDIEELKTVAPKDPRAAYLRALAAERDNKPELARAALKEVTTLIDPVPIDFILYRPQLLLLNALAHFGLNEPEKAKHYFEVLHRVQSNTPASKLLAQFHLSEGRMDRAIDVLEVYLKANPTDAHALSLLSSALMAKGQHAKAAVLMQQALQTKDTPGNRAALGLSLAGSGNARDAIPQLEAAYKKDPRQTQAAAALVAIHLRGGQTAKAESLAEGLVKQQPSNPGFFNLLGIVKQRARNPVAAQKAFEQSVKLDNNFIPPRINLARLAAAAKDYATATANLAAVLKIDEKNSEAMYEMAILSDRQGKAAETQRWLEKASDMSGITDIRWDLALSDYHLRNGRAAPALAAAKRAISKAPDDLAGLLGLARAQLANRDTKGAKESLISATRMAEFKPALQVQIAGLQVAADNFPGAAYSLEKALSGQPDYLPAMAMMAELELKQAAPAKAEQRARAIIDKYPKRAIGHSVLGNVAMHRGQTAAAVDAYRRAHQIEPSTETLLRLSLTLARQNDAKAAQQLMEQWVKKYPNDTFAQEALADAYANDGNLVAARAAYEKLLKIAPDSGSALNNLANVLLRLKDPTAAKVAEQAVAKAPNNPNAIDTLGWVLFQAGQTDRGLQLLRDARLRQPANPEIRYHLAVALSKAGRKTEAREELEAALKGGQAFEGAAEATALLKSLK